MNSPLPPPGTNHACDPIDNQATGGTDTGVTAQADDTGLPAMELEAMSPSGSSIIDLSTLNIEQGTRVQEPERTRRSPSEQREILKHQFQD